ncbi:MAG: hypothetical protein ACMUJM_22280 [bacterium]
MKNKSLKYINTIFLVILLSIVVLLSQGQAQVFNPFLFPYPTFFGVPSLFPMASSPLSSLSPVRIAAIPLANITPVTVTVPQVTPAGLTITSLVPSLAPAPAPTVSVIINLTAGTLLPTTFIAPFPLTPTVAPVLPTVTATVALPPATPTLTSLIALNLGGGIPGLGGGTTLLSTLPAPVPTTALPVVQVLPAAATPTIIPVI